MTVERRSYWSWLLPSVVVGLSTGVGYSIAAQPDTNTKIRHHCKEWYHRLKQNDFFVQLSQRICNTPWWLLLLSGPQAKFLLCPLLLYCLVVEPEPSEAPRGVPRNLIGLDSQQEEVSGDASTSSQQGSNNRYIEMLVHNVSHTDLVLSVDTPKISSSASSTDVDNDSDEITDKDSTEKEDVNDDGYCLCRPRFSAFDLYSKRILSNLDADEDNIISFPRYERSAHTPRYTIVTPSPSRQAMLPTGFRLEKGNSDDTGDIPPSELMNLRFRGRDVPRIEQYQKQLEQHKDEESLVPPLRFNFVFFPLLATLLPRWHSRMSQKYSSSSEEKKVKRVVILVTGVGTPRNWTHSISGNSTQACAQLMERFINVLYPDVTVVRIHSETNIFRYDENISFAKRELMPCIDAYRDAHSRGEPYPDEMTVTCQASPKSKKPFSTDWRQSFAVAISFADGSPARTHAIQASLRSYHPTYFHFWQLKTFWHDTKIVDDDIEVHSFEDMEGVPAMETSQTTDANLELVVKEMCAFRQDFMESMASQNTDIFKFWLRKTKKPVLAVLLVEKDGRPALYRGTNMEVSMPTGSLCAERNVIGTALANNPGLKREDLRMVAVLAVPLATTATTTTMGKRTSSMGSFASIHNNGEDEEGDWVLQAAVSETDGEPKQSDTDQPAAKTVVTVPKSPKFSPALGATVPPAFDGMAPPPLSLTASKSSSPPGTPRRLISLFTNHGRTSATAPGSIRKQKRTVVVHSSEDLNPLKPCGACNEWLKKIAESNPYFKVVTFTDADCAGVYVSPCQE